MKDKQARELIDTVNKTSLQNLTQILYLKRKTRDQQEQIRSLTDKIESLTDKIESMDKTLDSFGFRSCPKCKRGTMTIKYHYMRPFDVKEDGTLYKRPEYECLVCGTKYDLKEQPVIKEDNDGRD